MEDELSTLRHHTARILQALGPMAAGHPDRREQCEESRRQCGERGAGLKAVEKRRPPIEASRDGTSACKCT